MNPYHTGSRELCIFDEEKNLSFNVLFHYPTFSPAVSTAFGPYEMEVSTDAEFAAGAYPLVVLSHGNGGSALLYRSISNCLVKNGFIVALVTHYGNNRNDNRLENTIENLELRPRHITLTIDRLVKDYPQMIRADKIAVIGHSMGGYTALALAGGVARTREGEMICTRHDDRVKAIVLLAPGAGWFKFGLDQVDIPILMLAAQHDQVTPLWNAEIVLEGVADKAKVDFRVVQNAGHFSFLSPFPAKMKKPGFLPATDPDGFNREAFHQQLPEEVLQFLTRKLLN